MASVFVLTTDNGTHSTDSWADMISQLVFPISPDIAKHKLLSAKSAQLQIAEALSGHAEKIINSEKTLLKSAPEERLTAEHDGHQYVDESLGMIYAITDKTQWKDYMRNMESVLRGELLRHFNSMQDVERQQFADHNMHIAEARAYKAKLHGPRPEDMPAHEAVEESVPPEETPQAPEPPPVEPPPASPPA